MEKALHLVEMENALDRGRVIMYAPCIKRPVFTDYVLVACCSNIGTYMVSFRRDNKERATYGRYNTKWDRFQNGEKVRQLYSISGNLNSVSRV
jgi:hypothetical protein